MSRSRQSVKVTSTYWNAYCCYHDSTVRERVSNKYSTYEYIYDIHNLYRVYCLVLGLLVLQ